MPAYAQQSGQEAEEPVYYLPTFKRVAQSYWRLGKFDGKENNENIDNYLRIAECELYREFYHNEFEWITIRESSKQFLADNRDKFPLRYAFHQNVALGDYDFERGGFNIAEEDQINGIRIFEMPTLAFDYLVCGDIQPIPNYPKAIVLELNRPLLFNFIPIEEEIGNRLITKRMDEYTKLSAKNRQYANFRSLREVVLIMHVTLVAYRGPDVNHGQYHTAKFLSTLEEVFVYSDATKSGLLYYKNYRKRRARPVNIGNDQDATGQDTSDEGVVTEEE